MSLVARIYLSMGSMVVLILLVGGFASLRTNDLAKTFDEYRETARNSLLASNLSQNISDIRLSALKYRFTSDPELLETVSEKIEMASGQASKLTQSLDGYSGLAELGLLPELLQNYLSSLRQASQKRKRVDDLVEVTTVSGRDARQKTTDIIEVALRNNQVNVVSGVVFAKSNLLLGRLYLERFLVNYDIGDYERSFSEIEAARASLSTLAQEPNYFEIRSSLQSVLEDLDQFSTAASELKDTVEEQNQLYAQMDEIGPQALMLIKNAVGSIENRQNTLGPLGAETASRSIMVVSTLVVLGALIGVMLAVFAGRTISRRLGKVTADMTELAEGNLEIEIEAGSQKHEIGKMTDAMAVFLQNARDARDLNAELEDTERKEQQRIEAERANQARLEEKQLREEAERNADKARMTMLEDFQSDMEKVMDDAASGNFSVRMPDQVDDANLAKLAHLVNGQLQATETNVMDIVSSIGELAKGNLAVRIQGDRQGVFLAMKEDFNASVAALSNTMSKILQSGEIVSDTSVDLKNSSKDMSKRAEDNAATVEETSAAVEEITASIRQVVASAKAADQATQRVRQSADDTRSVSTETEASINAMTDASAQINRVVKVIEDIAFQINLLALNAGVEAARAGEAGLGFSVVASEVRALALRSQEAVQEITQVIEQSNLSVEAGAQQVGLSRQALEGIITEVEVASGQISEIASAVEEQAKGIEEVNTALRAIDVNAQKNAATLEVMTVSSVSLSEEASQLSSALGEFQGVATTSAEKKAKTLLPALEKQVNVSTKAPSIAPKITPTRSQAAVAVMDDEGWDEF